MKIYILHHLNDSCNDISSAGIIGVYLTLQQAQEVMRRQYDDRLVDVLDLAGVETVDELPNDPNTHLCTMEFEHSIYRNGDLDEWKIVEWDIQSQPQATPQPMNKITELQLLLHTIPQGKVHPKNLTVSFDEGLSRVLEITPGGIYLDGNINIWYHFNELSDAVFQQVYDAVREAVDTGDTYMDWENSDLIQAACEDSTIPNVIECAEQYMDEETFHKFLVDIAIKGDS